jgi:hypothetical protein
MMFQRALQSEKARKPPPSPIELDFEGKVFRSGFQPGRKSELKIAKDYGIPTITLSLYYLRVFHLWLLNRVNENLKILIVIKEK